MSRTTIHESHAITAEPGPYPPGEGPLDYADCEYHCRHLNVVCAAWWPTTGWVCVEQPDESFNMRSAVEDNWSCTACNRSVGYTEGEYEGAYGLRMVLVWTDCWAHPSMGDVVLCENCTCAVEDGRWQ